MPLSANSNLWEYAMHPFDTVTTHRRYVLAVILFLFSMGWLGRASAQPLDRLTTGRTYMIAFPDTSGNLYDIRHPSSIPSIKQVMIYSATEGNRVTITNNATKQVQLYSVAAGAFQTTTLLGDVVDLSGSVSSNTWKIEAADPIILYCYAATPFGAEAWAPLPVETWGGQYSVNTMPGDIVNDITPTITSYTHTPRVAPAEVLILSAFDNTRITIYPKGKIAGTPNIVEVTLQAGQAYQIQSFVDTTTDDLGVHQPDITGTVVISNNPIGVIAATTRTANRDLGSSLGQNSMKNPLIEAMPPQDQWGRSFLYLPTADIGMPTGEPGEKVEERRPHEIVRLITGDSATVAVLASMTNQTGKFDTSTVSGWKGTSVTLGIPNPAYFLADTSAMVMMSSSAAVRFNGTILVQESGIGARYTAVTVPYMVELTPREQWPNVAPFVAPSSIGGMAHYVNIAVAAADRSKLRMKMNGIPLGLPTATSVSFKRNAWMSIPGTDLEWASMELSPTATYLLYGADTAVRFYGYVYGQRSGFEEFIPTDDKGYTEEVGLAYGYPLAPRRRVLAPPDSLEIEQSNQCGNMRLKVRSKGESPVGFAEAYLEPPAANARIVARNPADVHLIPNKTQLDLEVAPIDPIRNAEATLVLVDRTGHQHRFPYNYVGMNVRIAPSDSAVDFGEFVVGGQPHDTTISICNPTDHPVTVYSVRLSNPNSQFTLDTLSTQFPVELPAGGCLSVTARITPATKNRTHTDSLMITFGSGCRTKAIALHAKTVTYCVYLGDLDFGVLGLTSPPRTMELSICNEGTGTLTFADSNGVDVLNWSDQSFSVPPTVVAQLRLAKLKQGECFKVPVTFTPKELGPASTTARVFANARSCRDTSKWTATVTDLATTVNGNKSADGKWWIMQNRPNPFGNRTRLEFSVGERGNTRVVIYNEAGMEVAELIDNVLEAGVHHLEWDASAVPVGRYYCRMISAEWNGGISLTVSR